MLGLGQILPRLHAYDHLLSSLHLPFLSPIPLT